MQKIFFRILCFFSFLFISFQENQASDIEKIIKKGTLVVGLCTIYQPPFYYVGMNLESVLTPGLKDSKAELTGVDIELAKMLAKELNVKLQFVQTAKSWDDLVKDLEDEKIDLAISFLSQTPERATRILFSSPYARIGQAMLINRRLLAIEQKNGAQNLEDIFSSKRKNTLIVYEGSSYIEFAKSLFPDVKIITYKTQKEIIDKLLKNEAIAFLVDEVEIRNLLKEKPELRLKLVTFIMKEGVDLISVGISRNNQQLFHFINTVLQIKNFNVSVDKIKF